MSARESRQIGRVTLSRDKTGAWAVITCPDPDGGVWCLTDDGVLAAAEAYGDLPAETYRDARGAERLALEWNRDDAEDAREARRRELHPVAAEPDFWEAPHG